MITTNYHTAAKLRLIELKRQIALLEAKEAIAEKWSRIVVHILIVSIASTCLSLFIKSLF